MRAAAFQVPGPPGACKISCRRDIAIGLGLLIIKLRGGEITESGVIDLIITVTSTVLQFVLLVGFKNSAVKYSEMVQY